MAIAEEGAALREALGPGPVINVFAGHMPGDTDMMSDMNLTPMINSIDQLIRHVEALPGPPFGIQLDTGMNRLGMEPGEWSAVRDIAIAQGPVLIMSHLVSAEDADDALNAQPHAALQQLGEVFDGVPLSLSNSGGVWLGADYHEALTRPGIALFGGGLPPEGLILRPGLTLEAPILQVRQISAGETVGYGATWRASEPTLIATLAIGYGDGFPRSASNKGFASLGGKRCPILGRVSMDLITIDVTQVADLARPGIYAQLIGPEAPLEEQAALAGTIGYELTTGLTPRVKRIYEP